VATTEAECPTRTGTRTEVGVTASSGRSSMRRVSATILRSSPVQPSASKRSMCARTLKANGGRPSGRAGGGPSSPARVPALEFRDRLGAGTGDRLVARDHHAHGMRKRAQWLERHDERDRHARYRWRRAWARRRAGDRSPRGRRAARPVPYGTRSSCRPRAHPRPVRSAPTAATTRPTWRTARR
jgi:hypothetical protein